MIPFLCFAKRVSNVLPKVLMSAAKREASEDNLGWTEEEKSISPLNNIPSYAVVTYPVALLLISPNKVPIPPALISFANC